MPDRMNIIGKDLVMEVQQFFEEGKLSKATNHTFITLIQKKKKQLLTELNYLDLYLFVMWPTRWLQRFWQRDYKIF